MFAEFEDDIQFWGCNIPNEVKMVIDSANESVDKSFDNEDQKQAYHLGVENTLSVLKQLLDEGLSRDSITFYYPNATTTEEMNMGVISMAPTKAEKKKIESVLHKMVNMPVPNMCHWVYKVRRGRLTRIIIWTKIDLGTMTEQCLFVTNYDFELIDMDFTKIEQVEEKIKEHSVLLSQVPDNPIDEEQEEEPTDKKSWGNW